MNYDVRRASRVCLLSFAVVSLLRAQVSTADVVGTVLDKSGAAVPSAAVVVTNRGTGIEYKSISGADGNYRISLLPAGPYRIAVEKPGFKTWAIAEVNLGIGDRYRADATLELGTVQESVVVQAESPALQTEVGHRR